MHNTRNVIHTRHVLAVKDLKIEAAYYIDKLGFERDFTAPGWEFLSFGIFKVMLGECTDSMWAHETGDHSYCSYVFVQDVDEIYQELRTNGAAMPLPPQDKSWGLREFLVRTPSGHRITFGQEIG
ncbi:MAG: VOC family protein [Pyrinomonadaceae bacterium]